MTRLCLPVILALLQNACLSDLEPAGEAKTERQSIDLENAMELEAGMEFPAGEVAISGGGR